MARNRLHFLDDAERGKEIEQYGELRDALHLHIGKFANKHGLSFDIVAMMLGDLAVSTQMIAYVASADDPSAEGLGLELDELRRDVEESVQRAKNKADEFVAAARRLG